MNLADRVKNILITPKTEWLVIATEAATPQSLLSSYVAPLAGLTALSSILNGLLWAGAFVMKYWIITAILLSLQVLQDILFLHIS